MKNNNSSPPRTDKKKVCIICALSSIAALAFLFVIDPRAKTFENILHYLNPPTDYLQPYVPLGHRPTAAAIPTTNSNTPTRVNDKNWTNTLHQTVQNLNLTKQQTLWQQTWKLAGFQIITADDAMARRTVERLARETRQPAFLRVYDALATSVQRSDFWRYAILWLEGGIYADIDVLAHKSIRTLTNILDDQAIIFTESLPIFDSIPLSLARYLSQSFLKLGLTDLVRLPQRRNCIFMAPPRHALMLRTLELIIRKYDAAGGVQTKLEPTFTLELTGPGIFTDAIDDIQGSRVQFVSRFEGLRYFEHVAQGSWKTYRGKSRQTRIEYMPHERRVRNLLLLTCIVTGFAAYRILAGGWKACDVVLIRRRYLLQRAWEALCVAVWQPILRQLRYWFPYRRRSGTSEELRCSEPSGFSTKWHANRNGATLLMRGNSESDSVGSAPAVTSTGYTNDVLVRIPSLQRIHSLQHELIGPHAE